MGDDLRKIRKTAAAQGLARGRGQERLDALPTAAGCLPVLVHKTESDPRAIRNTIARMRERGLVWPPPRKGHQ